MNNTIAILIVGLVVVLLPLFEGETGLTRKAISLPFFAGALGVFFAAALRVPLSILLNGWSGGTPVRIAEIVVTDELIKLSMLWVILRVRIKREGSVDVLAAIALGVVVYSGFSAGRTLGTLVQPHAADAVLLFRSTSLLVLSTMLGGIAGFLIVDAISSHGWWRVNLIVTVSVVNVVLGVIYGIDLVFFEYYGLFASTISVIVASTIWYFGK